MVDLRYGFWKGKIYKIDKKTMVISCVPRYFTMFHSPGPERMAVGQKPSRSKQNAYSNISIRNISIPFFLIMRLIHNAFGLSLKIVKP